MFQKPFHLIFLPSALAFLLLLGWRATARGEYESAEYKVLKSDGPFEIREYPDLTLASAPMKLESKAKDDRFMRLFRYISGANDRNQKVAMTTPVFMQTRPDDDETRMGFVIPKVVSEKRVPLPTSETISIRVRPGGRFAVIRFSGRMSDETISTAQEKLRNWMERKGLNPDGHFETAGYDPPWTPGPMRRNEVLVRVN